jgi:hypothetical protein
MRALLYKIACAAGLIIIGSTGAMILAVLDVSFNTEALVYFKIWFLVLIVCFVLIVPHLIDKKLRG